MVVPSELQTTAVQEQGSPGWNTCDGIVTVTFVAGHPGDGVAEGWCVGVIVGVNVGGGVIVGGGGVGVGY